MRWSVARTPLKYDPATEQGKLTDFDSLQGISVAHLETRLNRLQDIRSEVSLKILNWQRAQYILGSPLILGVCNGLSKKKERYLSRLQS